MAHLPFLNTRKEGNAHPTSALSHSYLSFLFHSISCCSIPFSFLSSTSFLFSRIPLSSFPFLHLFLLLHALLPFLTNSYSLSLSLFYFSYVSFLLLPHTSFPISYYHFVSFFPFLSLPFLSLSFTIPPHLPLSTSPSSSYLLTSTPHPFPLPLLPSPPPPPSPPKKSAASILISLLSCILSAIFALLLS